MFSIATDMKPCLFRFGSEVFNNSRGICGVNIQGTFELQTVTNGQDWLMCSA